MAHGQNTGQDYLRPRIHTDKSGDVQEQVVYCDGPGRPVETVARKATPGGKDLGYDKNGNILALQRYGQTSAGSYGLIDNLTFTPEGNRLNRVDDAVTGSAYNNGFEFKDAVKQADEYAYDANGNLTKDLNKGIGNLSYNYASSG